MVGGTAAVALAPEVPARRSSEAATAFIEIGGGRCGAGGVVNECHSAEEPGIFSLFELFVQIFKNKIKNRK